VANGQDCCRSIAFVQTKVSFAVDITDNGGPGTNDFFLIQFSNGYSASGYSLTEIISIIRTHPLG
jgi:hypothetical protein